MRFDKFVADVDQPARGKLMRCLGVLVATFVAVVSAIALWIYLYPKFNTYTHSIRYEVKLSVDGVEHSASDVIRISYLFQPKFLLATVTIDVIGDATVVGVGGGRAIVALLESADPNDRVIGREHIAMRAYGLKDSSESYPHIAKQRGRVILNKRDLPSFVMFDDVTKPETARIVTPVGPDWELAPSIKLISVTVETTTERVTRNLQDQLAWWSTPGRPAVVAYLTWRKNNKYGPSIEPERLFRSGK